MVLVRKKIKNEIFLYLKIEGDGSQGSIIILCAWEVFFGTNVPAKKGSIFLIKGVVCLIDNQVLHKKMSSKLTSGLLRVEYD